MFVLLRTKRMQLRNHARHTASEAFPTLKVLCAICKHAVLTSKVLEVRENEIALRKLSGCTAQFCTLEGALVFRMFLIHQF